MRVITGSARGMKLLSVEGMDTRPTSDWTKESMFNIIQFDMKERKVGLVTVTDVEVNNDLSIAKVYYTILDRADRIDEDVENLKRAKGFIRSTLAKRLSTYKCPDIVFVKDESLETGNRIDSILKGLNIPEEDPKQE